MTTVVCFGDSNTWGAKPHRIGRELPPRFTPEQRWPVVMAGALPGVDVIEEGQNGRTTVFDDPLDGDHKNGARSILTVVETHWPIDLLIVMLGTNDLKTHFAISSWHSARGAMRLVEMVRGHEPRVGGVPQILLVTPAALSADADAAIWADGARKAQGHAGHLADVAQRSGCFHFDANTVASVGFDGVHLDEAGARALGTALAAEARRILELGVA